MYKVFGVWCFVFVFIFFPHFRFKILDYEYKYIYGKLHINSITNTKKCTKTPTGKIISNNFCFVKNITVQFCALFKMNISKKFKSTINLNWCCREHAKEFRQILKSNCKINLGKWDHLLKEMILIINHYFPCGISQKCANNIE